MLQRGLGDAVLISSSKLNLEDRATLKINATLGIPPNYQSKFPRKRTEQSY